MPVWEVVRFVRRERRDIQQAEILGFPRKTGQRPLSLRQAHDEILPALRNGEENEFRRVALGLFLNGHDVTTICQEVLAPVLAELGRMWRRGELEVYEEHRSCEFCTRLLHEFRVLLPDSPPTAPLAIGASLVHDPYTLPSEMVELVFCESGWRVSFVGHSLSIESLNSAVDRIKPSLLWLSLSHISNEKTFLNSYTPFAESIRRRGIPLIAGGRAVSEDLRQRMPFTLFCDNFPQLRTLADTLRGMRETPT